MAPHLHWLVPAQTTALACTLLLALIFFWINTTSPRSYLKIWAFAWSVYALRFVAELAAPVAAGAAPGVIAAQSLTLVSAILLLWGTYRFLSQQLPLYWVVAGAIGLLWLLAALMLGADFFVLAVPTAVVMAAAYAKTGWIILRTPEDRGKGRRLAGWAFMIWAVFNLVAPFAPAVDWYEECAFLLTALLVTCVATGFLLMYFEDARTELSRREERLRQVVQNMPVMLNALDENDRFVAWNRECERVTGYAAQEMIRNPRALEILYPDPHQRGQMLEQIEASGFKFRDREWDLACKNGEVRTISWSNIAEEFPINGWHTWAVGVDVSERRRVETELRMRAQQQEAIAHLGQQALAGADLNSLFNEAVTTAAQILGVEYCEVLELMPEGDRLIFRACLPELNSLVDRTTVEAGRRSQAGFTLLSHRPVVMPDIQAEIRFTPHHLMREHGIVSGMSVVIEGRKRPFGVLDAHSRQRRAFTEGDVNFLRAVANILAEAIDRKKAEDSLHHSEQEAKRLAEEKAALAKIGRIITSAPDIEDVYQRFAEEVRNVIPFDRIAINLIDFSDGTICAQYFAGVPIPLRRQGERFPLAGSMAEEIARIKETMVFSADSQDSVAAQFPVALPLWQAGLRTSLMTPLIHQDRVIGTLALHSRADRCYGDRDILLAENVAAQISGAIANAQLLRERQRAEKALRESESSLKSIFLAAPIGIGVVSNRVLMQVNDRVCEMVGRAREELIGQSARILYPTDEEFELVGRKKYDQIREHGTGTVETYWQHRDGATIDVLLSSSAMDPADWSAGVTFTALDITERKRSELTRLDLEGKLRQAQKMEAIGTLAGGIAHDFNNILSAIIGFAELAKIEASGTIDVSSNINEVLRASFRARDLVRQILTFSRQAETELGPIQVHLIVKEALKMLRASLPATIQLRSNIACRGMVMADPTQIHQVVMNLCTNAYHAMRDRGGLLEMAISETRVGLSPEPDLKHLKPGSYLKLSVRDTGPGIDPAIIHRIFDPYFTTKAKGKGTGLGLAVVHGIVKSHGGAIQVSSQLGKGTRFDIYFPMIEMANGVSGEEPEEQMAKGREKILFVDDEPAIEELGKRLIGSLGYAVSTCGDAAEALELFRKASSEFDLVITDMTMPRMTGDRLAAELMRLRPGLPVIVCTGFSEQINREKAQEQGIRAFIMKPFLKREIATVIRDVLDHRRG